MAARSRHTCSTLMPRRSASVFAERSAIAVRTQPGSTAFDVTPKGPASWAMARASPITPCLEAVYALPERSAFSPAVELVKTSRPKPRLHMPPTVNRASSNGPSRLMRIVSRQTSGSCSHTSRSWAEPMPWFTTSTSIGPSRRSVSATAKAQPSAVPRSAATYSRPTAASSVALRDTTITHAPAADSSSAASRPIPRPPPVTSATRPFILVPPCAQLSRATHYASSSSWVGEYPMSKVVRFYEHGGPEQLRIEELDVGDPGTGEVRIRVEAIGLNRSEAMFRAGAYLRVPKFPSLIGYEGVGIVEALGAEVQGFSAGDRVCVMPNYRLG